MPDDRFDDRRNDMRLLTPILIMVLIVASGFLYYAIETRALSG